MKKNIGFYPGEILVPKAEFQPEFSVVATDQFTSQPEYWEQVLSIAEGHPSAYHMIFPEALIGKIDYDAKISSIRETTYWYRDQGIFDYYNDSYIYVERTLSDGSVRKGLVGLLDIDCYAANKKALTRATEETTPKMNTVRLDIRREAALEMPHVLLLVDDPENTVIGPFSDKKEELHKCYDFDLMMGGGHAAGWNAGTEFTPALNAALEKLADSKSFNQRMNTSRKSPILYAVGDGNHSLVTAKTYWEELKPTLSEEEAACHPARFALVEICNLHDPALKFEPIHRAVFDVDAKLLLKELNEWAAIAPKAPKAGKNAAKKQTFTFIGGSKDKKITIKSPSHSLTVGSVQDFIDGFIHRHGGRVDYIHGEEALRSLCAKGAAGFLLPPMDKNTLFPIVTRDGALPRKTFSIGEACDKRYYLECRRIR